MSRKTIRQIEARIGWEKIAMDDPLWDLYPENAEFVTKSRLARVVAGVTTKRMRVLS